MEDLYLTASPEVIIIRRRMVSRGQEAIPAPVVTVHPRRKEARKLPSRGPTRRTETTVETGDTIGSEGLLVDIYQAVELTLTTSLCVLVIVGKTGTGVIEGVDEEEGSGTSSTTGSQVTSHPLSISITLLLESEHRLVGVTEREVKSLCWEITDDVGSVSLQREATPSCAVVRLKHSAIPSYLRSRRPVFNISSWFWINSLTRSIGAAAVFETAAETPPIKKSITKGGTPMTDSFFGGSLLMMKTGDRLIKGLRGDVGWSGKEWYPM